MGAFTGGLGWFGFTASAGHALLGFSIGFTAGQALGSVLFPMKLPNQEGPRLSDLTVSSATNGAPIPIGYGPYRFAGNIIWSPGLVEHSKTTKHSSKGGPSYSSTEYTYTCSFAVSFGESYGVTPADRFGDIAKIWFDSKVTYDTSVATLGITYRGNYDSGTHYNLNDIVTYSNGKNYKCIWPAGTTGITPTFKWFGWQYWSYYSGSIADIEFQKYPAPTIYHGTETQDPDPIIQGIEGVNATPAFRGLIYVVWEDFPLADFGNRVPNIQALVSFGNPTLAEVVQDLCRRAGLDPNTEVDVSLLA